MAPALTQKAGCCLKGFSDVAPRNLAPQPQPETPEHLICPCYRPKKNAL